MTVTVVRKERIKVPAGTFDALVLHPSINIDELDPEVDLDVCRGAKAAHPIVYLMTNSFGFGGINCVSVLRRHDD